MNKIINFPIFFNPRLLYYTLKAYFASKPDLIHAHDLPMVPLALLLKKIFRIRVLYDMHENYPAALKFFDKKGIINKIFKNPKFALLLDKYCIKHADHIVTVVEENKLRLLNEGIDENKISLVSNTVDLESFALGKPDPEIIKRYESKYVIAYTGMVSPERGLTTAVEAMDIIKAKIPQSLLLIIGEGPAENVLKEIIIKRSLSGIVEMLKWCGHENLISYLTLADICIIPQPNNEFINTTIPHKLFEYMSQSKPVLVSDALPLKRIVEETECGLSFISGDADDFARKVVEMYNSNVNFGANGRKAVENKYNWTVDSKRLLIAVDKLVEK